MTPSFSADRLCLHIRTSSSVARSLVESLGLQVAAEVGAALLDPSVAGWCSVALLVDSHGGVLLDANPHEDPFAEGFVAPRLVLQPEDAQRLAGALHDDTDVDAGSAAVLLCAESIAQNAAALSPRAPSQASWRVVVQTGHDETPRVVFVVPTDGAAAASSVTSIFADDGTLALSSPEELIDAVEDEGSALAALMPELPRGAGTMELLAKIDAVFLRIARSGDLSAGRSGGTALLDAMATHGRRLGLPGWGEMYESMLSKAVACAEGDASQLALIVDRLLPTGAWSVSTLPYNLACVASLLGERERALRFAQMALEMGHDKASFAARDFDPLREDAAFVALLADDAPSPKVLAAKLADAIDALDVEAVDALLASGADPSGKHEGDAMLERALGARVRKEEARVRRQHIVARLLAAGASTRKIVWPWFSVVDEPDLVGVLLDHDVPISDDLLRQAVSKEKVSLLEVLIARGVVLRERGGFFIDAVRHLKTPAMLTFLLAQGVDLNAPPSGNDAPLALALASAGNLVLLEFAAAHGVNLNAADVGGGTLISHAVFNDNVDVVRWAIDHGVDVKAVDRFGQGVLVQALSAGAPHCFEVLLAAGAPLDVQGESGATALHVAAEANNLAAVKALLARGASRDLTDSEGKRPVDLATGATRAALTA